MKYIISIAIAGTALSCAVQTEAAGNVTPRLELHTGWDRLNVDGEKRSGLIYGVGAGVDFNFGSTLFAGLEANVEDSTAKACVSNILFTGDRTCVKTGRDLSAIARLGQNYGKFRAYVLGGYTNARLTATYKAGTFSDKASDNGDGWRAGAGVQFDITKRAFAKVEYRYSDYKGSVSRHQVVTGLGVNF